MGGHTSSKTTGSVYPRLNCALYGKFSTNIIRNYRECMNKFLVQTRLKTRTATRGFFFAHSVRKEAVRCEIRGNSTRTIGYRAGKFALSQGQNVVSVG